ncbi:MAG: hypothetical protein V3U57_03505 [Robiginitomaculum sp.]
MSSSHSNYVRGSMPIDGQNKTFMGFAKTSAFLTAFFIVTLLMPILVFAVHLNWKPALLICFVIGLLVAKPFKLKAGWYMTLIGLAGVAALASIVFTATMG